MDMSLEDYIALIRRWAVDRNIIAHRLDNPVHGIPEGYFFPMGGGTALGQARKLLEEASEALEAAVLINAQADWENSEELMKDAIGDTFVVLTILASGMNFDLTHQCVRKAWHEIRDRKGKMINGAFVKEPSADSVAYAMAASEGHAKDEAERKMTMVAERGAASETTSGE